VACVGVGLTPALKCCVYKSRSAEWPLWPLLYGTSWPLWL